MTTQITPEQVQNLLTLNEVILLIIALRLIGLFVWHRWFEDVPADDSLTQEERDERRVQRRRQR